MTDEGIRAFVAALCPVDSELRLEIAGPIEELRHQDYRGKRVHLRITEAAGTSTETKLDLGVHDELPLEQQSIFFDTAMRVLVYDDEDMRESSAADARRRLEHVLNDRRFRRNPPNARNNWLGADVGKVAAGIFAAFACKLLISWSSPRACQLDGVP